MAEADLQSGGSTVSTASVADGGTGRTSFPEFEVLIGNGQSPILTVPDGPGVLTSDGDGTLPYWSEHSGGGDYSTLDNKPTITEQDLGVIDDPDDPNYGQFGPLGTDSTATIVGDHSHEDYLMEAFDSIEIDAIVRMAENAGAM